MVNRANEAANAKGEGEETPASIPRGWRTRALFPRIMRLNASYWSGFAGATGISGAAHLLLALRDKTPYD